MEDIKKTISLLPEQPGCYLYKNAAGRIIYVGKAKNLKKRVSSYFIGSHNTKTTNLVAEIDDLEYVVTQTDSDAFVLENNLIKKHQPHFNILLKDDRTYPYIYLTMEEHPRLLYARKINKIKKLKYVFGPFPNSFAAKNLTIMLNRLFPFRKCESQLPKKSCLYYGMNQCLAPCIHKDKIDYTEYINKTTSFLKGSTKEIASLIKERMLESSKALQFEAAAEYKRDLDSIKIIQDIQIVELNDNESKDFINFTQNENYVSVYIELYRLGKFDAFYYLVKDYLDDVEETVQQILYQYYQSNLEPDKIFIDEEYAPLITSFIDEKKIYKPIKKIEKSIILNTKENANKKLNIFMNQTTKTDRGEMGMFELNELLQTNINIIESFDNSHLYGTAAVAGMIVWKNNMFSYRDYRKFNLQDKPKSDYDSMKEIIKRRYESKDKEGFPDIILVDGGLIQVNAALEQLQDIGVVIKVAGLCKDDYHKLRGLVYEGEEYPLDKHSHLYYLLAKISEEVHRFSITYHISKRDGLTLSSFFSDIHGIGKVKRDLLLKNFNDISEIKKCKNEKLKEMGFNHKDIENIKKRIGEING